MTTIHSHRFDRFMASLGAFGLAMSSSLALAQADEPSQAYGAAAAPRPNAADGSVYTDLGAISGNGRTVSLTRVPVKSSTGKVTYRDIRIQFDVSANGTLSLSSGYPKFTTAPALTTDNFRAGNYMDSFGGRYIVAGPGALPGGRSKWTLRWIPEEGKTGALEMTWATGPVKGHPFEGLLSNWKIVGTIYSWGVTGNLSSGTGAYPNPPFNQYFASDHVFGAWQSGNQLELHTFYHGGVIEDSHVFLTRCASTC